MLVCIFCRLCFVFFFYRTDVKKQQNKQTHHPLSDKQAVPLFHDTSTQTVLLTFCLPPAVCVLLCVIFCIPVTIKFYVILGYRKVGLFNRERADIKLNVTSLTLDMMKISLVLKLWCVHYGKITGWTSGLAVAVAGSAHSPWPAV